MVKYYHDSTSYAIMIGNIGKCFVGNIVILNSFLGMKVFQTTIQKISRLVRGDNYVF